MRKMLYSVSEVNHYLNSNQRKNLAGTFLQIFFCFGKFPPQICRSCGATYRRICEMFSALQSTSGPLTDGINSFQIDA